VALAPRALDDAGQEAVVAVVPSTAGGLLVPFLEDLVRLLEEDIGHQRVMLAFIQDLPPADLAQIGGVLEHVEDDAPAPLLAVPVPMARLVELLADRR